MPPLVIITLSICAALLISPSLSLTCTSQKFTNEKTFPDCMDLPQLDASLHYSYNSSNSSLSIAYVAAPAKPDGWVAWAINPTSTGMVGAQALLAFKSNGAPAVKTYPISAYGPIREGKLSFDVWDLSAESVDNKIALFASMKLDDKVNKVNQVWQVGPGVAGGVPLSHDMDEANTKATGVLTLVGAGGPASTPSSTPAESTPASPPSTTASSTTDASTLPPSPEKSEGSAIEKLSGLIIVMLGCFIGLKS